MTRPNRRRAELSPVAVRLSPSEREALLAKAARAGKRPSDVIRAAIAAYVPPAKERIT